MIFYVFHGSVQWTDRAIKKVMERVVSVKSA